MVNSQQSMRGPRFVNYGHVSKSPQVRVICPLCGAGGAHYLFSYVPKCHICHKHGKTTEMLPASNRKPEATFDEARQFYIETWPENVPDLKP